MTFFGNYLLQFKYDNFVFMAISKFNPTVQKQEDQAI